MTKLWEDTYLQAVRLVGEIIATQSLDTRALCEAMDLTTDQLTSLLNRVQAEWDRVKGLTQGMKKFTIVGYYDDNAQRYIGLVEADTMEGALDDLVNESSHHLVVVAVFEGDHEDLVEGDSTFYLEDRP